jgi:D-Tyr-tRNAtyr deacylase
MSKLKILDKTQIDQKLNRLAYEIYENNFSEKELLIVSQFTLYGDVRKGTRPSFTKAAPSLEAKELYQQFLVNLI